MQGRWYRTRQAGHWTGTRWQVRRVAAGVLGIRVRMLCGKFLTAAGILYTPAMVRQATGNITLIAKEF